MTLVILFAAITAPFLAAAVSLSPRGDVPPPSQPNLPPKILTINNTVIAPDGFERSSVLVNGQHPAPLLIGKKGMKFSFNVVNALTDPTMQRSTSIHWHGFFQKKTNYADGPAGISQCPISPGDSFIYDFTTGTQAGTFWYHSHFSTQYCDGLRGPFVVYDDNDPHMDLYHVDNSSTVITLTEWYHTQMPSLGSFLAHSTLINGKGRYPGGPPVSLSVVNVQQGKRYRFRLLSLACEANFMFSIDGHEFLVIEADGENIKPYHADKIQIFVGQRYSFVLEANQPIGNYWIRALPNLGRNNISKSFDGGINSAILHYLDAPSGDPDSQINPQGKLLDESELQPYDDLNSAAPGLPFPGGADVNINLNIVVDPVARRFLVNNHTYIPPSVPVLLQMLSQAKSPQELMPAGSIYPLSRNKTVEVTIPGGSTGGPHPFHLHGHAFSVIKSAGANTQPNYVNPVRRDVVSIGGAESNVTIRFVTDNPGPWMFHCHIDVHLEFGLAIVFAEDQPAVGQDIVPPVNWYKLCETYNDLPPSETVVVKVPEVP